MLKDTENGWVPEHKPDGEFTFDEEVTSIFDNMAERSIPFYHEAHRIHAAILAARFSRYSGVKRVLDIGASTGAFLHALNLAVTRDVKKPDESLVLSAMDISEPMTIELRKRMPWVNVTLADVTDDAVELPVGTYDAISLFYVLQFIPKDKRVAVLGKVYKALKPNGVLIVGQKDLPTLFSKDKATEYHRYRLSMGYGVDEIYHKSVSLAKCMQPITTAQFRGMLTAAGFKEELIEESTRWLQFSTLMAVKE